jgi:hypothetical protein
MNIDNAKSYATRANLVKALEKAGLAEDRHVVVCNTKGRYTAIFPVSNLSGAHGNQPGSPFRATFDYIDAGFMIFG